MLETSINLLESLRRQPDEAAWQRLVALYQPLLHGWVRRQGLSASDADDLVQEIMTVLVRELPQFQHNQQTGAFRRWLRLITVHRLRAFWRQQQHRPQATGGSEILAALDQLEQDGTELSALWEQEHDRHVTQRLLEHIRSEFQPASWQAFTRVVLDGLKPAEAAAELKLSVNAVLIAKSRVLQRLRQEGQGLLD